MHWNAEPSKWQFSLGRVPINRGGWQFPLPYLAYPSREHLSISSIIFFSSFFKFFWIILKSLTIVIQRRLTLLCTWTNVTVQLILQGSTSFTGKEPYSNRTTTSCTFFLTWYLHIISCLSILFIQWPQTWHIVSNTDHVKC